MTACQVVIEVAPFYTLTCPRYHNRFVFSMAQTTGERPPSTGLSDATCGLDLPASVKSGGIESADAKVDLI